MTLTMIRNIVVNASLKVSRWPGLKNGGDG
jgi:hypothetical protein